MELHILKSNNPLTRMLALRKLRGARYLRVFEDFFLDDLDIEPDLWVRVGPAEGDFSDG